MKKWAVIVSVLVAVGVGAAQTGSLTTSVYWRVRVESWNFFDPGAAGVDNSYTFVASLLRAGVDGKVGKSQDWRLELSQVTFGGLPENAIAPAPAGDLGLGATYYRWNRGRDGSVFVKQAYWQWRNKTGKNSTLRLGRFEFGEGTERMPKDPNLSWLRRNRIQERLIGLFGFVHVQRSFDGILWTQDNWSEKRNRDNLTIALLRPTRGAFDLKGNDELKDITVGYASWTFAPDDHSDARIFALWYYDKRKPPKVVKVDNRPIGERNNDTGNISIPSIGFHYIRTCPSKFGKTDFLLWGTWQAGRWGRLDQRAGALALELGHQWTKVRWQPWLRIGYFHSTGDEEPNDPDHQTFFQMLSTPRLYARTLIYNLMNNRDLFAQLMLKPSPKLSLRLDWHMLWLTKSEDFWYAGGGAFNHNSFGYIGRPSGGSKRLMDLLDLSIDYTPDPKTTWTLYLAKAWGKDVVRNNFPAKGSAFYAYLEFVRRW
ncbi:alginate export family protein [Fervidibacter sp.]|jgi:hypothetical protein